MIFRYVATIYFDDEEVNHENGDDVEELYTWMLIKTQGKFGNFSGEIKDNKTGKIVKRFRKAPPE